MDAYAIPFNRSSVVGRELEYIAESMRIGQIAGDQTFTRRCHQMLEEILGVSKVLLTTSCTHALEMSALLLDIQQGDEVILPSFTFVSAANAFVLRGARPVFADIHPDTMNIDERHFAQLITSRTKALVLVHYAGVACEMDEILKLADRHGIAVVEDNAHGLFAKYRGRYLGTLGRLATQSFHETKNFTCGEGGALLVNDPAYVERAEIIREKGTNRKRFLRGQVDKYTWVDIGSSYLMSDVLAAFLYGQLECREEISRIRRGIWDYYNAQLAGWAEAHGIRTPVVPDHSEQAHHMFYILLPSSEVRSRLIAHLRGQGILAVFHYQPLHLSEMGRRLGGRPGDCPVTEDVSERLLRLPFYNDLSQADQDKVIMAIRSFRV